MGIIFKRTLLLLCVGILVAGESTICWGGQIIDVYILAGQSNAVGYNNIDDYTPAPFPAALKNQNNIMFWPGSNARAGLRNTWTTLQVGASGINSNKAFGPEITFGHQMAAADPEAQIAIVKYAVGATGIARSQDYSSDTYVPGYENYNDHNNNWHPPEDGKPTGNHYRALLSNISNSLNALENQGKSYRLAGFLWMQGEHEGGINSSMAADYEDLLTDLVARLRQDLDAADLPVVIGQITERWNFADIIMPAQKNVCDADPLAAMVVSKDIQPVGNVHYTANGMLVLGSRFATEMQTLQAAQAPEPSTVSMLGMVALVFFGMIWRKKR